jgi:ubiquinone/menaquinone biosynthesis C-methylase UbiE
VTAARPGAMDTGRTDTGRTDTGRTAADTYSHGHHESVLRSHRWRTAANSAGFLLPHLRPGLRLVDVGCGPGTITADLADAVAPGPVLGLDRVAGVVAQAADEHRRANLRFAVGDAYALGLGDDSVDVVFAHQVLQHLSDPVAALAEWRRVTRPGGLVAARDSDYGGFVWSPADPALDRWMALYHDLTRRNRADADAGRSLHRWARAAGFAEVRVTTSTWTFHTAEERAWWGGTWADRVRTSAFAEQTLGYGLTTPDELAAIAAAFERWADDPDGLFVVLHGEILATA